MNGRASAAVAAIALWIAGYSAAYAASGCDRDCLIGIADTYLAAIAAHDPGKAPFAANVRSSRT